ncbi:MAG: hypothetical protein HFJ09_11970 [Lachnospiraceae bacterium]|nr:hypothetical protein [Lachnospiraceae bacterium]
MSKNREVIYLDELLMKIRENKEVGEIMGNTMMEIAKGCKTVQKEEMTHFEQIKREEVMPELGKDKDVYCVTFHVNKWGTKIYDLKELIVEGVLELIKEQDVIFYERIEESEG